MVTNPTIHVSRDRYHLASDPAIEPIVTVDSGDVVEFDLLDASCGQLDADCGVPQLLALNFERRPCRRPDRDQRRRAGDTLQIDLLLVRARELGLDGGHSRVWTARRRVS